MIVLKHILLDEDGVSLVEMIAAVLIVTVILFSFYSFFISSKKTNVQSDSISDATYLAQTEMENIYTLATSGSSNLQTLQTSFLANYTLTHHTENNCVGISQSINELKAFYQFTKTENNIRYAVKVSHLCQYENTGRIVIEIYELSTSSDILKAQVEGVYMWK